MATERLHLRIHGRVQGVFYRQWTMSEAKSRNLSGWVRNRIDGTVEAIFIGDTTQTADMFKACKKGPPRAFVTKIIHQLAPDAVMEEIIEGVFEQKRTV